MLVLNYLNSKWCHVFNLHTEEEINQFLQILKLSLYKFDFVTLCTIECKWHWETRKSNFLCFVLDSVTNKKSIKAISIIYFYRPCWGTPMTYLRRSRLWCRCLKINLLDSKRHNCCYICLFHLFCFYFVYKLSLMYCSYYTVKSF